MLFKFIRCSLRNVRELKRQMRFIWCVCDSLACKRKRDTIAWSEPPAKSAANDKRFAEPKASQRQKTETKEKWMYSQTDFIWRLQKILGRKHSSRLVHAEQRSAYLHAELFPVCCANDRIVAAQRWAITRWRRRRTESQAPQSQVEGDHGNYLIVYSLLAGANNSNDGFLCVLFIDNLRMERCTRTTRQLLSPKWISTSSGRWAVFLSTRLFCTTLLRNAEQRKRCSCTPDERNWPPMLSSTNATRYSRRDTTVRSYRSIFNWILFNNAAITIHSGLIDALAVISTSKLRLYDVVLDAEADDNELLSIFMGRLNFEMVYDSQRIDEELVPLSTAQSESKVLFNRQHNHWNGMLIHLCHANGLHNSSDGNDFNCRLKIYSK